MDRAAAKLHADAVLAARLGYAERKWLSFAAPFTARWVAGLELKKGIKWACEETHGIRWGATINPYVIRAEFAGEKFFGISLRYQNVGIATGAESGIFDIEVDTAEHGEGVDGEAVLKAWEAEHGELPPTLMARSPSGSIHRIFKHPGNGIKIKSLDAILGKGVDCKGDGGMFLGPPSYRPPRPAMDSKPAKAGGFYIWINEGHPVADAPQALLDVVISKPAPIIEQPPIDFNPFLHIDQGSSGARAWAEAALNNEAAIVAGTPKGKRNHQLNISAFALGQIVGGGALTETEVIDALLDAIEGWDNPGKSRNTINNGLRDGKLQPRIAPPRVTDTLEYIEPSTPAPNFSTLEAARQTLRNGVRHFIDPEPNPFSTYGDSIIGKNDIALAFRIDTGVGKTLITLEEIAKSNKSFVYAVPTLALADEVAQRLAKFGVIATIWRGRDADDPENPGEEMCLNPEAVELALKVMADVSASCCKHKKFECKFYKRCGYQRMIAFLKKHKPRVVIVAADMLFHQSDSIGTPDRVIIDEMFWNKQLRGIDDEKRFFIPFDRMRKHGHDDLADVLARQQQNGGLQRDSLYWFGWEKIVKLIAKQYEKINAGIGLYPGMSRLALATIDKDKVAHAIYYKNILLIAKELRNMYENETIDNSGRLLIEDDDGVRGVRWRGVGKIVKQFRRPTLILDATLPDIDVLRITHPLADVDLDIRVALPESVVIRQVIGAPTSKRKLVKGSSAKAIKRHRQSVLRYIVRRYIEIGKGRTLVVCNQEIEEWLRLHLPADIELLHFNALAGLDGFKDVRLQIIVGRPQPIPQGVEALAATLTGAMPEKIVEQTATKFNWYDQVQRGIRLADGTGVGRAAIDTADGSPEDVANAIAGVMEMGFVGVGTYNLAAMGDGNDEDASVLDARRLRLAKANSHWDTEFDSAGRPMVNYAYVSVYDK